MKKIISGALAAALVVGLAACSTAYYVRNLTVTITANGSMNLSNFSDSDSHTVLSNFPASRVIPLNGNNTAKIQLSNTVDGLNTNVFGSYADGDVRFTFKGQGDSIYCRGCSPVKTNMNKIINGVKRSQRSNSEDGRLKVSGSTCVTFTSLYESTNRNMPGTGFVVFNVCDAPVIGANPVGEANLGSTFYDGSDYVTVYIPTMDPGDLNPFANYYSGGTLGAVAPVITNGAKSGSRQGSQEEDRSSSTSVTILYAATEPSATPTPIWPSPGPTLGLGG